MFSSPPRFAVAIPLYNHERYIGPALQSVLDQTRRVDEIILIDDGSRDGGFALASRMLEGRPGTILRTQPNAGAHVTINRCIEASTADYVAVLNSDDIFHPGKIERCAALVAARPELGLILGGVRVIDPEGATVTEGETVQWLERARAFLTRTGVLPLSLLHENFAVTTSNMVFRRDLWQRNGGFQPLRYCHDADFLAASARNGILHYDGDVEHIAYRIHPQNTIKEALTRIRVEIAGVMVSALLENRALTDSLSDADATAALLELIRAKNLSDLALVLAHHYPSFPSRTAFYEDLTTSPRMDLYAAVLAPPAEPAPTPVTTTPIPMRIAIEVGSFDKGGLEKVVLDSAILFRDRGITPLVISVGPVGHLGAVAASHGIEVVKLPPTGRAAFYRSLLQVRGVALAMSHFSRVGYPVFRELGIPNITFIHNVYAMLAGEPLAHFKADDSLIDRYISVSPKATRYAVARLGVDAAKIATVPNGLILDEHRDRQRDVTRFDRAQLGIGAHDYVFLNVASYNLHKGHYLMAQALQIVRRQRDDVRIVCIGNEVYPPHVRELRAYLVEQQLDRHMLLPGYFADVAPLHRMSDAFLLPSFLEGWSIAMNEAMFHGKPMILTDTGAAADVIENEDIGIIVPNEYGDVLNLDSALMDELAYAPRDYQTAPALAAAMLRMAQNPDHWRQAGQHGRQKVIERYDFSDAVDRYITEIRNLARPR